MAVEATMVDRPSNVVGATARNWSFGRKRPGAWPGLRTPLPGSCREGDPVGVPISASPRAAVMVRRRWGAACIGRATVSSATVRES